MVTSWLMMWRVLTDEKNRYSRSLSIYISSHSDYMWQFIILCHSVLNIDTANVDGNYYSGRGKY